MKREKNQRSIFKPIWAGLLIIIFGWTIAKSEKLPDNKDDARARPTNGVLESRGQSAAVTKGKNPPEVDSKQIRAVSSKGDFKKIPPSEIQKLEGSCHTWLKMHIKDSETEVKIRPKDPKKYCRCFVRNFSAVAESKRDPLLEIKYFVDYFSYLSTDEELEQMGDYFYAIEDITGGCLEDLNFKLEL